MANDGTQIKSLNDTGKTVKGKYGRWKDEITKANKALDKWHRSSRLVIKRFLDEREASYSTERRFNIFSANVEILQSSLYSKIPKVDVSRRFDQPNDDVARVAALMLQNCIKQDMEDPCSYFDQVMRYSTLDVLLPGMGCAWLRLENTTETRTLDEQLDPVSGVVMQEESEYEAITNQDVAIDYVHWDDFIYSPCRTWEERRWVGRKVYLDYDALELRFGKDVADKIPLQKQMNKDGGDTLYNQITDGTDEILERACIYEIWDRQKKEVLWLCLNYPELLDTKPDPLELDDFEPFPKPMMVNVTTSACIAKPDFVMVQDQYNEMDMVNNRISLLVQACKVVGVYDQAATGVQRMLQEGTDNTLIPVDSWAMFAEKGGIKGAVDWLPLDQVIQALEKLRQAREDIKGQIYELTGISDIVRGDTKASETLGAQQLKAQFASVRITAKQAAVARFAQDILRIKGEIICKHFTPEQIIKMSGIEFYPDGQNPQVVQDAVALLKAEHETFEWRIKIQADTLIAEDNALVKKDRVEFINSVATFLQSAATTLKAMPDTAPILFETLKFTVAGFKGASELEGVIDQTLATIMQKIQNPPPAPPDPAMMKAQADMQAAQQKHQMEMQKMMQEQEMAQRQMAFEMDMEQRKQASEQMADQQKLMFDRETAQMKLDYEKQMGAMKIQQMQLENAIKLQGQQQDFAIAQEQRAADQQAAGEMHKEKVSLAKDMHKEKIAAMKAPRTGTLSNGSKVSVKSE